jgi:hypothetical protein
MRMRMGMGMGAWVQGDSASPGARCSLARHAIHHQSATRHTQHTRRAARRSSSKTRATQTLFRAGRCQRRQRRPPGVASAAYSSMGALRHGGRWESGHVRVGIGMPSIPACATAPS